jgi:hypothetical protein
MVSELAAGMVMPGKAAAAWHAPFSMLWEV